jgi:hypothetical protein
MRDGGRCRASRQRFTQDRPAAERPGAENQDHLRAELARRAAYFRLREFGPGPGVFGSGGEFRIVDAVRLKFK